MSEGRTQRMKRTAFVAGLALLGISGVLRLLFWTPEKVGGKSPMHFAVGFLLGLALVLMVWGFSAMLGRGAKS